MKLNFYLEKKKIINCHIFDLFLSYLIDREILPRKFHPMKKYSIRMIKDNKNKSYLFNLQLILLEKVNADEENMMLEPQFDSSLAVATSPRKVQIKGFCQNFKLVNTQFYIHILRNIIKYIRVTDFCPNYQHIFYPFLFSDNKAHAKYIFPTVFSFLPFCQYQFPPFLKWLFPNMRKLGNGNPG